MLKFVSYILVLLVGAAAGYLFGKKNGAKIDADIATVKDAAKKL
jgi:hypothetical protein